MIKLILFVIFCGFCNIARGERLFLSYGSTVVARIVAMSGIGAASAILTGNILLYPVVTSLLILWCTFGWDSYWSAEIGNDPQHSKFWGFWRMSLRGITGMEPLFIALWFMGYQAAIAIGSFSILQGVPYLIFGIPKNKAYSIPLAEFTWGMCIGGMLSAVFSY